jgi:hypothetical protein
VYNKSHGSNSAPSATAVDHELKGDAMTKYTEEQQSLINQALENQDTLNGFVTYEESERIVERSSGQKFGVFGCHAYELFEQTIDDEEFHIEYIPVIIDGKAFGKFPDEGKSGILHLYRISKSRGKVEEDLVWSVGYLSCGWLRTQELEMSAAQILENISAEIDAGATHLTGYQPRG